MKTWIYSFFLALTMSICSNQAQAWEYCDLGLDSINFCSLDFAVEGRVAYFKPSSKKVQEIYGNGWADYQVELSTGIGEHIRLWTGVSGFKESGRSLGLRDRTTLRLIPLNFGLKYFFCLTDCTKFYVGAALACSFLKIRDHSDYVQEHTSRTRVGGLFQAGWYYYFNEAFFADIFVDYYYQKFNFSKSQNSYNVERHDVNLSGFKMGGGLGYKF